MLHLLLLLVAVLYVPPVDAPVIDPFRPPPSPYAPGNRGLTYGTSPGQPVHASAAGEVVFAGQVGGERFVTVAHPDGLRTSYAFLGSVAVVRGQPVAAGDVVGTTSALPFHFGVRDPDGTYLDPALLLARRLVRDVHLVPLDWGGPPGAADTLPAERATLAELARAGPAPSSRAVRVAATTAALRAVPPG